jgi:hypothetical protein
MLIFIQWGNAACTDRVARAFLIIIVILKEYVHSHFPWSACGPSAIRRSVCVGIVRIAHSRTCVVLRFGTK